MTTDLQITEELRNLFERNPKLQMLLPQPKEIPWRYFHLGRSLEQPSKVGFPMFAWSTERDRNGKFRSWVWHPLSDVDGWKTRGVKYHNKRKDAKSRALRMRDQLAEKIRARGNQ